MTTTHMLDTYHHTIRQLSDRIVLAQKPIRVLDAIKWDSSIQDSFFQSKFKELPPVTHEYYEKNPLPFDPSLKMEELYSIELDVRRNLGQFSAVGGIMQRMCREYRELV